MGSVAVRLSALGKEFILFLYVGDSNSNQRAYTFSHKLSPSDKGKYE